jgi:hypothetical protein
MAVEQNLFTMRCQDVMSSSYVLVNSIEHTPFHHVAVTRQPLVTNCIALQFADDVHRTENIHDA